MNVLNLGDFAASINNDPHVFCDSVSGRWQFRPLSAVALYSVCVYGTVLTLLWFTMALPLGTLLATHKHFGVTVFVSTSVSYFLIVLVLPVVIWAEARNVALYLNDWERFQVRSSYKAALQI